VFFSDEEHLHCYTQSLISGFMFTNDEVDELVTSEKKLAPIVKLMKKEIESNRQEKTGQSLTILTRCNAFNQSGN